MTRKYVKSGKYSNKHRMQRIQTDYRILGASDFIIMDAISRKPMTTRELSHATTMSKSYIVKTMRKFVERGLVVLRSPDKRWVPLVVMRVETPRETVEDVTGTIVHPQVESQVGVPKREVPTAILPPPPPMEYKPPDPRVPVSERAGRISAQMRIPSYLMEYGEVSIGKLGACVKCNVSSPVTYGEYVVCPVCARKLS